MPEPAPATLPHPSDRIRRAVECARRDAEAPTPALPRATPSGRVYAMGDPQAPLTTVLAVLDAAGILGEDGRLRPDVHLVSIGDHFDWGQPEDREAVARDGLALLSWLAAHPPERVTLIVGNHDLARVGELLAFDAAGYAAAREEADRAYLAKPPEPGADDRFHARYPDVPSAECLSRDLSSFSVGQRDRVAELLRNHRFCGALALGPRLLATHAGLTRDDLRLLGLSEDAPATQIAPALNGRLDAAADTWDGASPFALPGLHQPGKGRGVESRGVFAHRPAHPDSGEATLFDGPPRRRFDPRRLPPGLTQVVGHSGDAKCRKNLRPWTSGPEAAPGQHRCLLVDADGSVRYAAGLGPAEPGAARLVFIDGGMARCPPERYALLDVGGLDAGPSATVGG